MIKRSVNAIHFDDGPPSNFFGAPIVIWVPELEEEIELPTSEHGFQLIKAVLAGRRDIVDLICATSSPARAKRLAGPGTMSVDPVTLSAWDGGLALEAMVKVNIAKYTQNWECCDWLIQTGDLRLVEHRPDRIWGDNLDGTGKNLLGLTLELIRALVR